MAESVGSLRSVFKEFPAGGQAELQPLFGSIDAWITRWRAIEEAEATIDLTYFILDADPFGLSFLGILLRKADEGVRIRLLVDSLGTVTLSDPKLDVAFLGQLDRHPNIEVRVYSPVESTLKDVLERFHFLPAIASNHDKLLIIDDERAIVGGRNIADEYFSHPRTDPRAYFDSDVLIDGRDAIRGFRHAFTREFTDSSSVEPPQGRGPATTLDVLRLAARAMDAWMTARRLREREAEALDANGERRQEMAERLAEQVMDGGGRASDRAKSILRAQLPGLVKQTRLRGSLKTKQPATVRGEVRVLDSCSQAGCGHRDINRQLLRLVSAAQKEILIENPYVMLTEAGVAALEDAGRRGVRITILTNSPSSTDSAITQAVFLEQWPALLARVPNLRLYVMGEEHNIHAKLGVIDGQLTLIGSYNLDFLSAFVNSEVLAAIWSRELAEHAKRNILRKIERGSPVLHRYDIARDDQGRPILRDGEPVVAFGPSDHVDLEKHRQMQLMRSAISLMDGALDGLVPLM